MQLKFVSTLTIMYRSLVMDTLRSLQDTFYEQTWLMLYPILGLVDSFWDSGPNFTFLGLNNQYVPYDLTYHKSITNIK